MSTEWKQLADFAAARRGHDRFALATLLRREGSSYRQPGARLLIAPDGAHVGCLSGGCLEAGVAQVGLRVLRTGVGEALRIDTRPHFGCPGVLDLWVEPVAPGLIDEISAALAARRPAWLETRPDATGTRLLSEPPFLPAADGLLQELPLLPRLIVASATSDADPLCELARWMGWEVRRVTHASDPGVTANSSTGENAASSAPRAEVVLPEQLPDAFPSDERTACVVMTHHLGRDSAYLRHALTAGYPYVGLLGSRRRREALIGELGEHGLLEDPTLAERLRAPVGLDLGAEEPRGIALAIVAEIQAAWAGAGGGPLRDRRGPVHVRLDSVPA